MHIDCSIAGIRFWFCLIFFVPFSFSCFSHSCAISYFSLFSFLLSFSSLLSFFPNSSVGFFYIFLALCQSSRNVVTTFIKLCGRVKFLRSSKFIRTGFIGIARKIGNRKRYSAIAAIRFYDITKK